MRNIEIMNNIMLEFTRNDKRFNESQLMNDFFKHIENNWYRLVQYGKKDNKIRIYSNYIDIKDVVLDYKNYKAIGFKRVKE
jgi:uncharacterized protein YktA (UPF0223 family)